MSNLLVGGVETFSAVDFPGKLAAVVFLQGCVWRCPFCYNTDLQPIGKPTDFLWEKFIEFLKRRRGRLDAVVFSGGEPLVHNDLAATYNKLGQYDDAVQQAREILHRIGDKSQYAAAQYNAGVAYEQLGDLRRALQNYELSVANGNKSVRDDVMRIRKKLKKQKITAFNYGADNIKSNDVMFDMLDNAMRGKNNIA